MKTSNQVATLDEAKAELGELEAVESVGGDGRDRMRRVRELWAEVGDGIRR
jgi:hypothetical protein